MGELAPRPLPPDTRDDVRRLADKLAPIIEHGGSAREVAATAIAWVGILGIMEHPSEEPRPTERQIRDRLGSLSTEALSRIIAAAAAVIDDRYASGAVS